ncbi:MAG: hypothetical protein SVK08_00235 [Halobacteriota archaeon]|nr:hypothetical protein [Halobacteriota archaeon]
MGTRNLSLVYADGEYKMAKYCQWDGYPESRGVDALEIARSFDPNKLREVISELRPVGEKEANEILEKTQGIVKEIAGNHGANSDVSGFYLNDAASALCPGISRNYGMDLINILTEKRWPNPFPHSIMPEIADRLGMTDREVDRFLMDIANYPFPEDGLPIFQDLEFAADSIFCEWAYLIDLDNGTFEVFEGFNHDKLKKGDRFYFLMKKAPGNDVHRESYWPIKLAKSYPLDDLPDPEVFIEDFQPEEGDE